MKGEDSGRTSAGQSNMDDKTIVTSPVMDTSEQQNKVVRRRWHVPSHKDVTTNTSMLGSANKRGSGTNMQELGELKGDATTSRSPLQSPTTATNRNKEDVSQRHSGYYGESGGDAVLDNSDKAWKKDNAEINKSEAKLFATEVKRYSKETVARGAKQLRKKFDKFFRSTPPEADLPIGGELAGSDDGKSRKKRRGAVTLFWLQLVLPCVGWIRTYKFKECFASDAIAGISVAMMVVPQSISYAALAGLPSEFGLYTALIPVFVYALFGSSRQLAVGPVAIVSLLMKEGLHKAIPASLDIQDPNNPEGDVQVEAQIQYSLMAVQITFIVGIIEFVMGLTRLGFLTNFLSHSVILGFTHGSAILIGLSQIKHVIGIKAKNSKATIQDFIASYAEAGDTFDWRVLIMGLSFLTILLLMKEVGKRSKNNSPLKWLRTIGPLTASILGIVVCYAARLDKYGIPLVGKFDGGFPPITYGELFPMPSQGAEFITTAISCAVVGFLESISIMIKFIISNCAPSIVHIIFCPKNLQIFNFLAFLS